MIEGIRGTALRCAVLFGVGLGVGFGFGVVAVATPAQAANEAVAKRLFASQGEAQQACGKDDVVWLNKKTEVYHLQSSRWFGKTKDGAYGCQSEMDQAGYHAAKIKLPK